MVRRPCRPERPLSTPGRSPKSHRGLVAGSPGPPTTAQLAPDFCPAVPGSPFSFFIVHAALAVADARVGVAGRGLRPTPPEAPPQRCGGARQADPPAAIERRPPMRQLRAIPPRSCHDPINREAVDRAPPTSCQRTNRLSRRRRRLGVRLRALGFAVQAAAARAAAMVGSGRARARHRRRRPTAPHRVLRGNARKCMRGGPCPGGERGDRTLRLAAGRDADHRASPGCSGSPPPSSHHTGTTAGVPVPGRISFGPCTRTRA